MKQLIETVRWWVYFLRCELIYALGGVPAEHLGTIHYRNIEGVVESLLGKIAEAEKEPK